VRTGVGGQGPPLSPGDDGKLDETQKLPPPVTVRDLFRILRRRALLALFTFALVVGVTLYFTAQMPKVYQAKARLLLDAATQSVTPTNILETLTRRGGDSLETEIEKINSRSFLTSVIQSGGLKNKDPEALRGQVIVSGAAGGRIMEVSVKAETAEEARDIANLIAKAYIALVRKEYVEKAELSRERLVAARETARKEKAAAEVALNAFNARVGLSDPGILYSKRAQQTVETRMQLEDSRRGLDLQLKSLRDLEEQRKRIPPTVMTGYAEQKNPVIDGYRQEIVNLETQKKKLLFDYAPDSDEVKAVDAEIQARREAIAAAEKDMFSKGSRSISRNPDYSKVQSSIHDTRLGIEGTRNNIKSLSERLARLEAEQKRFADQQIVYEGLKRKRDGANEAYEQARLGLIKIEMDRYLSAPNTKILDDAILPPQPVSPKPTLNLAMALCLGFFLGGGMALLAEYLSSSATGDDYDAHLPIVGGVPLLGTIPFALPTPQPAENSILPAPLRQAGQGAVYAEDALREIGYALAHRHPREPVPVILLTGTRSDDSTAALAAQLTATLVRDGLRVTLVDADRNKPRLNRVFGKPDAPGLSDVLAGRKKVREILYTGADGSLRFLAAGSPEDQTPFREAGLRSVFHDLAADRDTDLVVISGPSVWQTPLIAPLEKTATGMALIAPDAAPADSVARVRRLLSNGYKPRLLGVIVGSDTPLVSGAAHETELAEVTDEMEEKP
jgi:polysaccharide biosynthesis transport protein